MSDVVNLEIPRDLQNELDALFPESTERQQIASILMFWPTKPTTREAERIGKSVKRSTATANEVVRILIENGYFSKDLGSMPLYRYTNKKAGLSLIGPQPAQPDHVNDLTGKEDTETGEEDLKKDEDDKPSNGDAEESNGFTGPFPGVPQEVSDLLATQQKEIEGLQRTMDTKFDELKELVTRGRTHGLSVKPEGDNPSNPTEAIQTDNPGPAQQEEQTTVEPIGALLPGLSRDQLIEIGVNQPGQIRALMGLPPRSDEGIESLPITTRVVAVDLNTYTMSVFERVVHDGYDGSMSDFLNDAAYKYFEDRGKRLDWVDTKRGRRRLP